MSKRRNMILLASGIFAIVLGFAVAFPHQREEPIYGGRTCSQWLKRIEQGQWGAWDEAPIRAIGTNGIPTYLRWISFEQSPLRNRIAKLVEPDFPKLSYRLTVSPGHLANRVVFVFQILGPQAHPAIPELTRLAQTARDRGRFTRCLNSLAFIGPDAIPSILTLASKGSPQMRGLALWKLADFGTNAVAAVPALRLALTDAEPYVTNIATRLLVKIAPEAVTNTPAH
jgi:hypothetical protein